VWALRGAGLRAQAATRTLLVFLVVLYSIFLSSIALSGVVLTLGLVNSSGPVELSAVPAAAAMLGIALCLALARRRGVASQHGAGRASRDHGRRSVVRSSARLIGDAVGEAAQLVRLRDPRLAGAIAYWAFDAAVVWAMLHAFGSAPAVPVIALAYFIGQVADTLPTPARSAGG
jgi:hypothetical protein